jgi:hypothetical protein
MYLNLVDANRPKVNMLEAGFSMCLWMLA